MKIFGETFEETDEKTDEKTVLLAILGGLEALQKGVITIEEAEKFIFSPYMAGRLKVKKCRAQIIELIEKGCELEDIHSLLPYRLNQVIDELKNETLELIDRYETFDRSFWIEEIQT